MSEPSKAEELKELGNAAFAAKDFEKAIGYYTDAVKVDPTNHIFFSNRSASYAGLGKWAEAIEDAKECLKLDPKFMKGYYRLATAQLELKEFAAAQSTIKQGLSLDPSNSQLQKVLKTIKLEQKSASSSSTTATATTATSVGGGRLDSATSKELYELKVQHAQTVRDYNTFQANLVKAEREMIIQEKTSLELQSYDDSNKDSSGGGGGGAYYQSVGKIFRKSSKPKVLEDLNSNIDGLKKKQTEMKQKMEYLERRMKSQQQNMQELVASG